MPHKSVRGKGSIADIDDDIVEGFSLALMDCHCPGQHQRVLGESADNFRGQLSFIDETAVNLPAERFDFDGAAVAQVAIIMSSPLAFWISPLIPDAAFTQRPSISLFNIMICARP